MKYVYNIKDIVNNEWLDFCSMANNDGSYVRKVMPLAIRLLPLRDMKVLRIGTYCEDSYFEPIPFPEEVSWDCYEFPENKAENLASVGLSTSQLKEKFDSMQEIEKNK